MDSFLDHVISLVLIRLDELGNWPLSESKLSSFFFPLYFCRAFPIVPGNLKAFLILFFSFQFAIHPERTVYQEQ